MTTLRLPLLRFMRLRQFFAFVALLIVLFIIIPPITIFSLSLSETFDLRFGLLPVGLTLEMYIRWSNMVLGSIRASMAVALPATFFTTLIGLPAAYALARRDFPGRAVVNELVLLPMIFPPIILAFGLYQLFLTPGLRDLGTWFTLVAAHTVVCTPFLIRPVVQALQKVDVDLEEAAQSLGASPVRAFVDVVLPTILPALVTGMTLAIARSLADFEITLLLTSADYQTLPILIYSAFDTGSARLGSAVAVISILFSIALITIFEWFARRAQWW
jgi:putative spermidine/putrescine transport system permease protein